jgi:hypothetical protein
MASKRKSPPKKPAAGASSTSFSGEHYRELGGEGTATRERGFAERGSGARGPDLGEEEAPAAAPSGPRGRTVK